MTVLDLHVMSAVPAHERPRTTTHFVARLVMLAWFPMSARECIDSASIALHIAEISVETQ